MKKAAIVLGLVLLHPSPAHSQAWVPPAGQVSVNLSYQYLAVGDHLMSQDVPPDLGGDGTKHWDLGDITGQTGMVNLDAGITDRIAASASVAYVAAKYVGTDGEGVIDDGSWNHGVQDFALGLRYIAVRSPVVVTPSMQVTIPSHAYDVLGHAAIGRNLTEVQLGLNLGWVATPILRGLYVQGSYSYTISEKHDGVRPNRSDVGLGAGYFVTQDLVLWTTGTYTYTHQGLDWLTDFDEHVHSHDQLAKKIATIAGGGVNYVLGSTSLGASVMTTLGGENTHDSTAFIVSVGRTFNLSKMP